MEKITIKICSGLFVLLHSISCYADHQGLKKFEKQLVEKYKNAEFFEVNGDIEAEISNKISEDNTSFTYDFLILQQKGYIRTHYSPDKKLKFYTFDISGGGTMGEWSSYVQYKAGQKLLLDEFQAGYIQNISQVNIKNKPTYLVENYYKGDSCHGAYNLRAVEVGSKQLLKSYIFESKNKKNHDLSVEYDCNYDSDRSHAPNYFRIKPKTVDVMFLNSALVPQNKYLRYSLGQNGYRYIGIVK